MCSTGVGCLKPEADDRRALRIERAEHMVHSTQVAALGIENC